MTQYLFSRRPNALCGTLVVLLVGVVASPALAATPPVDTSACSTPQLSQPFLSVHDGNWYTLAPGQTGQSFDGTGWVLSGGARILTTKLADGTSGSVLDLPSGSKAVSPTICVTSSYPIARTMVRNVVGAEGVFFYVSYAGTNTWTDPRNTGQVHGSNTAWTISDPVNIQPSNLSAWQPARFTFIPGGHTSDFQIYDFYVDPRMKG